MTGESTSTVSEHRTAGCTPPRLDLEEWQVKYGVVAGITGADDGFDLGLWGTKPSGGVLRQWRAFQDSFEPSFGQFVVGYQHHGTQVGRWQGIQRGLVVRDGFDGHLTTDPGTLLTVLVADCVPVYLLDPASEAVALLHAGWRGVAGGILSAGIEQLEAAGTTNIQNLVMHCGVSVCGRCYEVGPEVIGEVTGRNVDRAETLDLRSVLAKQAVQFGIHQVTVSPFCTVHDSELFHSYRAHGERAGRMAAYLGVPLS